MEFKVTKQDVERYRAVLIRGPEKWKGKNAYGADPYEAYINLLNELSRESFESHF